MKKCSKCGATKPESGFHRERGGANGLRADCRDCRNKSVRDRDKNNPGKKAAVKRAWRHANSDKVRKQKNLWHKNNPESGRARSRANYLLNKAVYIANARKWVAENPEKRKAILDRHAPKGRERSREWRSNNRERHRASVKQWQKDNPDKVRNVREVFEAWKKRNPERWISVMRSHSRARVARKLKSVPAWANQFVISEIYDLARRRTRATGIEWHVDHVVPLRSKIVCGLHVEHNLRVIPGSVNCSKANRHWPDMP